VKAAFYFAETTDYCTVLIQRDTVPVADLMMAF